MSSMFFSQQWADGVRDVLNAGPDEEALAGKLQEYWDFYNLVRYTYPSSWALGARNLPAELGGGTRYLVVGGAKDTSASAASSMSPNRWTPHMCWPPTITTGKHCSRGTTRSGR